MSEPFIQDDVYDSMAQALRDTENRLAGAIRYAAHVQALLRETCDILEKMEVSIEVSEPLQFWWEKEKRRREAQTSGIDVVGARGPIRDGDKENPGSTNSLADQPSASNDSNSKVELIVPEKY